MYKSAVGSCRAGNRCAQHQHRRRNEGAAWERWEREWESRGEAWDSAEGAGPAEEAKLGTGMGRKLGQPGIRGKAPKGESRYQLKDDEIGK